MEKTEQPYDGVEKRRYIQVREEGILKVWHFLVSQVVLFITLLVFMGGFGSWTLNQLQSNFYPSSKGKQLEDSILKLNNNIENQNLILTDLRIFIARNMKDPK